ncbi:hypothetical protein Bca52824_056908 [Brassica carinata]|uniref:Uncharacterized protein n=1 Tax=Brassica carinata TaxID=52824 RepID=A0A8X7QV57_BRACI|nr:hypothetical protein Bca52824_056908 [Brassica carinata]
MIYQDHNTDYGNKGIYSTRLGIVSGIKKGICGRLRKSRNCIQWRWNLEIIKTALWIFTDESLWCIIVLLFWLIKFQKLKFFVIMTQSQLLNHGEEQLNGEGMRKRLKISVAHFDNSAMIKTYSKTLIGRCMNPEEQEMKRCLQIFQRLGNWRTG